MILSFFFFFFNYVKVILYEGATVASKSIYGRKLMNPEVRVEFRHLYDSVMSDNIHI